MFCYFLTNSIYRWLSHTYMALTAIFSFRLGALYFGIPIILLFIVWVFSFEEQNKFCFLFYSYQFFIPLASMCSFLLSNDPWVLKLVCIYSSLLFIASSKAICLIHPGKLKSITLGQQLGLLISLAKSIMRNLGTLNLVSFTVPFYIMYMLKMHHQFHISGEKELCSRNNC